MANRKISQLTALTTPAAGDYLPIVDISEAADADKNKRITIEELLRGAPDGTAAAPSIAFESDPDSGLYSTGANGLALATGGTGRLFITSDGKLGLGTSSPGQLVQIGEGDTGVGSNVHTIARIEGRAVSGGQQVATLEFNQVTNAPSEFVGASVGIESSAGTRAESELVFKVSQSANTNATEAMRLSHDGRLGINTASPSSLLNVSGGLTTLTALANGTEALRLTKPSNAANYWDFTVESDSDLNISSAGTSDIVHISYGGNVGIGTTSPGAPLHVNANSATEVDTLRLQATNGGDNQRLDISINATANTVIYDSTGSSAGAHIWQRGGTESARIDSSGKLLVGTSSSTSVLNKTIELHSSGTATGQPSFETYAYPGTDAASAGRYSFYKSRGSSVGSNVIVSNGDVLGYLHWLGANGTGYDLAARISGEVDAIPSASGDMPGRLVFSTTANGSSTPTERMRIASNGSIGINTQDPIQSSIGGSTLSGAGKVVTIQGDQVGGARCLALASDPGAGDFALQVVNRADYSTKKFVIYGDGSVENTDGSIGTLSDIRFKSNIQPAKSQWADIKDIEIVNYDLDGEERRLLGVVAQQVETVSPGLVVDRPKYNENGEEVDSIKGVRTSILYMKAVKALQEAMERIEVLEQRLTDAGIA